jgi:hypothetical protein
LVYSNLESLLPVRPGQASHGLRGIAAWDLLGHLLEDRGLALEQTGPYPLVLRVRGSLPAGGICALDTEPAFHDRTWAAYSGRSGESTATVHCADADHPLNDKLGSSLAVLQRSDGGWSQRDGLQSGAYATGQALYALQIAAGTPTSDPCCHLPGQLLA